jgi:adenine-specific DNA-methyltransferase
VPTLNWIGKEAVVKHHKEVPFHLIELVPELSTNSEDNRNLVVQGDNLLALKALLPRYAGQVKCIYIDPPYNTGNEGWVYNDNVNSPEIRKWLGEVVGKEGETLDRHDRWLCMMYPRLVLLKKFLRDDGLIFISIDDNENPTARMLLDEIFDKRNFVATFVWNTEGHTDNQFPIKISHEYIICYARKAELATFGYVIDPNTREESNLWSGFAENSITKNGPKNPPSEITLPIGFPVDAESLDLPPSEIPEGLITAMQEEGLSSNPLKRRFGNVTFPLRFDSMIAKESKLTRACRVYSGWANANKLKLFIQNNCQPLNEDDGQTLRFYISSGGVIYYRRERGQQARNIVSVLRNLGTTEKMRSELERMNIHFTYPKPKELIKYLLKIGSSPGDLVLDSFAGSGTTGHAVLEMSAEDDPRQFILIEMSDTTARNVTATRLQKIIQSYDGTRETGAGDNGAGFQYCRLSVEPLFRADGSIRNDATFDQLAEFVWFMETGTGFTQAVHHSQCSRSPFLGIHKGRAVFLLYNGILADRTDLGGNVLNTRTLEFLNQLLPFDGPRVVYGALTRFGKSKLTKLGLTFHQLPYELAVKTWI